MSATPAVNTGPGMSQIIAHASRNNPIPEVYTALSSSPGPICVTRVDIDRGKWFGRFTYKECFFLARYW